MKGLPLVFFRNFLLGFIAMSILAALVFAQVPARSGISDGLIVPAASVVSSNYNVVKEGSLVSSNNSNFSDFSCLNYDLVSLKNYSITCFVPKNKDNFNVGVSFSDGLSSSPVPSDKVFSKSFKSKIVNTNSEFLDSFTFPLSLWKSARG